MNANKKSDVYLKDFDNLIKFKKTFDAKFNDTLAVNTESLQESEGEQFRLPELKLVDLNAVLDKWIEDKFKQMERPILTDRLVNLYIALKEGENADDLTNEEKERRAVEYNQKNRKYNLLAFAAFTMGLTAYSLNIDA